MANGVSGDLFGQWVQCWTSTHWIFLCVFQICLQGVQQWWKTENGVTWQCGPTLAPPTLPRILRNAVWPKTKENCLATMNRKTVWIDWFRSQQLEPEQKISKRFSCCVNKQWIRVPSVSFYPLPISWPDVHNKNRQNRQHEKETAVRCVVECFPCCVQKTTTTKLETMTPTKKETSTRICVCLVFQVLATQAVFHEEKVSSTVLSRMDPE